MDTLPLGTLPTSNDPAAVLAHYPASVACVPVSVLPIPSEARLAIDGSPNARLYVVESGEGRRWVRQNGSVVERRTSPGMIEIAERDLTFDECTWQGREGRCLLIEFADADVGVLTHGELPRLDLTTRHELFDQQVSAIALQIAGESLQGLPGGRLYLQGLSVALLGLLAERYGDRSLTAAADHRGKFGAWQRQRLRDVIRSQPGSDLSLLRLAHEVGLSAHHFTRVFKATFGVKRHRELTP